MSEVILTFIATLQVKSAVFALLLLALLYGTRRLTSHDRFVALKIALGVLAILPLLQFGMPAYHIKFDWWPDRSERVIEMVGAIAEESLSTAAPGEPSYALAGIALVAYALVAGLLLLRLGAGLYRTQRDILRYPRLECSETQDLLVRLSHQLGVPPPALRVDETGAGPYVWGVGKPVIAVPMEFIHVPMDVKRTVLTHELIHTQRRDTLACIASKMLCCLYWINPAIWFLERRLKLEMERSCDRHALSLGTSATDYAEQLLEAVKRFNAFRREPQCAVSMARASSLQQRIRSLLATHEQRGDMSNSKLAIFGAGLLSAAMAIGAGTTTPNAATVAAGQQEPATRSTAPASLNDRAAYAAIQARINRMAPGTGDVKLSKVAVSAFLVEIEGKSANAKAVSELMRSLDKEIGAPHLHFVKKGADGSHDFKISLKNFDHYVPEGAQR